ncbi:signal-regulatory protein beta-2-like [Anabas testudineus]|uniref:signal-regulatory protein beta-2-like n=1 Tax=Anabas testudineus TaxID=64144 RepID=UPI000E46167C|nr:signal-regulatory protein beta-2-like [Anabas testudineus]
MYILFYLLLILRDGRCTDNQTFATKIVVVGENVTLTCTYQITTDIETYFWIKLAVGNLPEVLAKANSFDYNGWNVISRITTKQEPGSFFLNIPKTKLSDTGFYYCLKSHRFNITFLKGTFLIIKEPEADITAIVQDSPTDPVYSGDLVTLQCSILFDSAKKTCPEDHSVYWFSIGLDESRSNYIYALVNSSDQCERSTDAQSLQKCVYNFSKSVSSSDAGTYYCAVATCGEILYGDGTKLDVEVVSECDTQDNTIVFLLCVALAISLITIAVLVSVIMKTSYDCCSGK